MRHSDRVEYATFEWVDWFNNRRLFGPQGCVPAAEFEPVYHQSREAPAAEVGLT